MKKSILMICTFVLTHSALGMGSATNQSSRAFARWAAQQPVFIRANKQFNIYLENYRKQLCEPMAFNTTKYWKEKGTQHLQQLDRKIQEDNTKKSDPALTSNLSLQQKAYQKMYSSFPYSATITRTYNKFKLMNNPFSNPWCTTTPSFFNYR